MKKSIAGVLLLLILLLPVGADVSFIQDILTLKLKVGLFRWKLIPKKAIGKNDKTVDEKKEGKKDQAKHGFKLKINKNDLVKLLNILFHTLHRFRMHLSIDLLHLNCIAAATDPYDAVLQFGALNAGFGAILPLAETVLKIRERNICTSVNFEIHKPQIEVRVIATLQIWEILFIAICAGTASAVWYLKKRKQARTAAKTASKKGN